MSEQRRPGDWQCAACSNNNFARRTECHQCGVARVVEKQEAAAAVVDPQSSEQKCYYLSIDIERVGADFHYGVLAVGAVFGTTDGTVLAQADFCSTVPPPEQFEPDCWQRFWSQHPAILERINANATEDHIGKFHTWLLDLEKRYGPFGRKHAEAGGAKLKLVSDNPGYEWGMLSHEFFKLGKRKWIGEMFDDYVPTEDPTQQMRGLTPAQKAVVRAAEETPHDHWPVNDAKRTYEQMCAIHALLN